jgi:hypothetical protein
MIKFVSDLCQVGDFLWVLQVSSTNKSAWYNWVSEWVSEWVSNCYLTPSEQFFSHIMVRASYISIRWLWCPLCTRPTCSVLDFYNASSLKQQSLGRHVSPFGHIMLIPSQPVFALTPYCCVFRRRSILTVLCLMWPTLEPTIFCTWGEQLT